MDEMKAVQKSRVLIVDDDEDVLVATRMLLKREVDSIETLSRPEQIDDAFASSPPDVVLLDMNFGPGESDGRVGLLWLSKILAMDPDAVVILITAHGGVSTAVEAMKRGAADFVVKPWSNERLVATVMSGLARRRASVDSSSLRKRNRELVAAHESAEPVIVGESEALDGMLSVVDRAASSDASVLVLGENGTGKELIARRVHRRSPRAREVFVSVDLGSVSESVFESELFGHVKGAFTDARSDRAGRFVAASGGTLFLDEIANIPLHLQAKLLTALERRCVTPVGSNRAVPIDVRIVSATNLEAAQLADPKVFRQDLLFRLNTVEIRVPPLRNRREDIESLTRYYLRLYERKYGRPSRALPDSVVLALRSHDWPGNVRALRHAVERAVILVDSAEYRIDDFALPATATATTTTSDNTQGLNLEQIERAAIEKALRKHRYNISHTARELGITRAALYRRMEKHGL
ncbi:MAG: sigma-54 dependent transcriptional regulator [Myxococcota bacterium]